MSKRRIDTGLAILMVFLLLSFLSIQTAKAGCSACGEEDDFPVETARKSEEPPPIILKIANRLADKKGFESGKYDVSEPVVVYPERTIWVKISATDINRIVCTAGKITDVFYSQEKGVKISVSGHEAYLKLQAKVLPDGKIEYSNVPSEVYVVCGGVTYGFIGRPKRIPSRTIYLVNPYDRIAHRTSFRRKALDDAVVEVATTVFKTSSIAEIPPSWERVPARSVPEIAIPNVRLKEIADWRIPGVGVLVRLIRARAVRDTLLRETDFLQPNLVVNPIGIAIEPEKERLTKGESARILVIEKVVGGSR